MIKKICLAAVILVVFAQVGFAQQASSIGINYTTHVVVLTENCIWLENQANNWNPLMNQGQPIRLHLDETNPAYFALVYNSLKDFMIKKSGFCTLGTTVVTRNGVTYSKIISVYVF